MGGSAGLRRSFIGTGVGRGEDLIGVGDVIGIKWLRIRVNSFGPTYKLFWTVQI